MFGVQANGYSRGGCLISRSCSLDFFVPPFWAANLTLNPLSRHLLTW